MMQAHTVGAGLLRLVQQPTLVIHSREDHWVPFAHAKWSLKHIPQTELCESGFTGHFFWIGQTLSTSANGWSRFSKGTNPVASFFASGYQVLDDL